MKLAEALNLRADTQKYIRRLDDRLLNNARVQEGCEPDEQPDHLLEELNRSIETLTDLIIRINRTNHNTMCENRTLTEMLAERDALALRNSIFSSFLTKASYPSDRYGRLEGRTFSTVDVAAFHQKVNQNSRKIRELDNKIQCLNWQTELLE